MRSLVEEKRVRWIDWHRGEAHFDDRVRQLERKKLAPDLPVTVHPQPDSQRSPGARHVARENLANVIRRAGKAEESRRVLKPLKMAVDEKEAFVRRPPQRFEQIK